VSNDLGRVAAGSLPVLQLSLLGGRNDTKPQLLAVVWEKVGPRPRTSVCLCWIYPDTKLQVNGKQTPLKRLIVH
jgi:hypothetical protein